jgi:hypothetical protein
MYAAGGNPGPRPLPISVSGDFLKKFISVVIWQSKKPSMIGFLVRDNRVMTLSISLW